VSVLLGFDYGTRRIGVAVGQTISASATPLEVLTSRDERPDWHGIERLVREWSPDAAVVGLPFEMDGTEVDWSPRVHRFARQIEGRFGLIVHLVDERLSSIDACRSMAAGRPAGKTRRAGVPRDRRRPVDALAAALILETWLREQH
jgi:putative Holliday junction resolvase